MTTIEYLRQFRVGGYAVFDFTISFVGMALLAPLLTRLFRKLGIEIPFLSWMAFTLPVAIIFHVLFGKLTPMNKAFFDPSGHYLVKIVIVGLLVLGIAGIKKIKG